MTIIEKIKTEIERLKTVQLKRIQEGDLVDAEPYDKIEAYNELLSFLSTLESEKPMNQEVLEEEILNQWEDYPHDKWPKCPYHDFANIARHFAQWQKEQMMKEAVEGEVCHFATAHYVKTDEAQLSSRLKQFKHGDKVRIIVVKED